MLLGFEVYYDKLPSRRCDDTICETAYCCRYFSFLTFPSDMVYFTSDFNLWRYSQVVRQKPARLPYSVCNSGWRLHKKKQDAPGSLMNLGILLFGLIQRGANYRALPSVQGMDRLRKS